MNLRAIIWAEKRNNDRLFTRWVAMLPITNTETGRVNHYKLGYIIKTDDSNLYYSMPDIFTQPIIRIADAQPTAKLTLEEAMAEFFTCIQRCVDTIFEPDVMENTDEPKSNTP